MLHHSALPQPIRLDEAHHSQPGLVGWLHNWTVEKRRQRLCRDAFNTLLRVDDHILEDVTGLTRPQVEEVARLPLTVDALDAIARLQKRSSRRPRQRSV
ncbi:MULTISPECIES: hypothetical protein [Aurantimonas]|uniref:hypothetical protein n=1 Tax=Aurantimonas TaxID=182269 RepID=UPI00041082FF|nr:hypothetical protein [Aurantimonas coralicida]